MTKIVIADDEDAVLSSTRALLEVLGYAAIPVSRGEEILPVLRRERPEALLQDVRMPGVDLAELVRTLRADPDLAGIAILVFTADVDAEDIWKSVGADGFVEKPFDPPELGRILREVLRR